MIIIPKITKTMAIYLYKFIFSFSRKNADTAAITGVPAAIADVMLTPISETDKL